MADSENSNIEDSDRNALTPVQAVREKMREALRITKERKLAEEEEGKARQRRENLQRLRAASELIAISIYRSGQNHLVAINDSTILQFNKPVDLLRNFHIRRPLNSSEEDFQIKLSSWIANHDKWFDASNDVLNAWSQFEKAQSQWLNSHSSSLLPHASTDQEPSSVNSPIIDTLVSFIVEVQFWYSRHSEALRSDDQIELTEDITKVVDVPSLKQNIPPPAIPASFSGYGIRSLQSMHPPVMQTMFHACLSDPKDFSRHTDEQSSFLRYQMQDTRGKTKPHFVQILDASPSPLDVHNATTERESLAIWKSIRDTSRIDLLDEMAWDIAALAVTAFYARTEGNSIDQTFVFLVDDYLQWRGTKSANRDQKLRNEIARRIEVLCSVDTYTEIELNVESPDKRRRRKQHYIGKGPFLLQSQRLWKLPHSYFIIPYDLMSQIPPDGYLVRLGEWARAYVENKAMLGINVRRLTEYDMKRQQWERRIGWYLLFQIRAQCNKSQQHGLRMVTILNGAHINWQNMQRTNPGKVIDQFIDALETLYKDRVIGEPRCMDGDPKDFKLPRKGLLDIMLEWRWKFLPIEDQISK